MNRIFTLFFTVIILIGLISLAIPGQTAMAADIITVDDDPGADYSSI